MNLAVVVLLAVIQGAAELLPVSSSAHVIVAEKLLRLDPASPQMTFLLVMLHTGMGAVTVYFGSRWRKRLQDGGKNFLQMVLVATVATGLLGLLLKQIIERRIGSDVESLFGNLSLVAASLLVAGILIIASGRKEGDDGVDRVESRSAAWIGLIQGLCLPFRGFSRSGATISIGLFQGLRRSLAEDFSFSLAVVLTPPVILLETHRLLKSQSVPSLHMFGPGLLGMVVSFAAGLMALRLLSNALEQGRWKFFGYYCVAASAAVYALRG